MALSSQKIIQDEDDAPMVIEGRFSEDEYTENEILMESDDSWPSVAMHCPVCGIIFVMYDYLDGKCPKCGYRFEIKEDEG